MCVCLCVIEGERERGDSDGESFIFGLMEEAVGTEINIETI